MGDTSYRMHAREGDPATATHLTVTMPARPLVAAEPAVAAIRALHASKRAELDATLERLLLMPPGHDATTGPFAREYDELASRRRSLSAELAALEAALHNA